MTAAAVLLAVVGGAAAFAAYSTLTEDGTAVRAPVAATPSAPTEPTATEDPGEPTETVPDSERLGALALLAYPEQVASQEMLADLAAGRMVWGEFGMPRLDDAVPAVPVTVGYRDGTVVSGDLLLGMADGRWYFIGVTRGAPQEPAAAAESVPEDEYAAVVAGLASQEGTAAAGFMARVLDGQGGRVVLDGPVAASGVVEIPGVASDGQRMSLVILAPAGGDRLFLAGLR